MDEVAIQVEHVSKDFKLPHEKVSSVKNLFVHLLGYIRKRRAFEVQHALRDVSFEIKKGEFFGIVGRNGSGKSTMLKMLAGIYQPTKGQIQINGKLVPFIELGVGFSPELTGRENVYLNGALLGFSQKEIDAQYKDIVDFAELAQFMDQKLKNYSSGMQVRLAFSMAIRAHAEILLIDEVLAVGDADFQRKCFDYFRSLKKQKKTVVFVSHDMNAIREYCDRAIMIDDSRLVAEGKPYNVALQYTRLFNNEENKPVPKEATEQQRWGDGSIRYVKTTVSPAKVRDDKTIELVMEAEAKADVEKPIFGFSIKNAAGEYILGTNSRIKKAQLIDVKKGDKVQLRWTVPNVFADGNYFVNPAVEHADGITECDWFEEAASFQVIKDERTPYLITPDIKVEVRKQ